MRIEKLSDYWGIFGKEKFFAYDFCNKSVEIWRNYSVGSKIIDLQETGFTISNQTFKFADITNIKVISSMVSKNHTAHIILQMQDGKDFILAPQGSNGTANVNQLYTLFQDRQPLQEGSRMYKKKLLNSLLSNQVTDSDIPFEDLSARTGYNRNELINLVEQLIIEGKFHGMITSTGLVRLSKQDQYRAGKITSPKSSRSKKRLLNFLLVYQNMYSYITYEDLSEKTGHNRNELINFVEDLINEGKFNSKITNMGLIFANSVNPLSFEDQIYISYHQSGYLDLGFIAKGLAIDVDKIIRVLYRMMADFDGEIEDHKFKPVKHIQIESIQKLIQTLKEQNSLFSILIFS